jgi:hypothetical protein
LSSLLPLAHFLLHLMRMPLSRAFLHICKKVFNFANRRVVHDTHMVGNRNIQTAKNRQDFLT